MAKINFVNKVAVNENTNIPDVNKCKASDLNEIKEVVNQNDDNVGNPANLNTTSKNVVGAINELDERNTYSIPENVVGKWINGEKIYRKIIQITMSNIATTNTYQLGIKNLKTITKIYGIIQTPSNNARPLPFVDSNIDNTIRLDVNNGVELRVIQYASWANYSGYVILEYTKTID